VATEAGRTHAARPGTVERIQRAALILFLRQGYQRTALREIADELAFTKAALYYHYRSKEDLLQAVLDPLLSDLERLVEGTVPPTARERFLAAYLEVLMRHRILVQYLANDGAAVLNSDVGPRLLRIRSAVEALIVGSSPSLTERMRSAAALGALQAALAVVREDDRTEEVRATALQVMYAALGPDRRL
jgi:AcrR family transcriptional regulator